MSLTGTPFFLTAIAMMGVAVLLPLLLWGASPDPRPYVVRPGW